MAATNAGEVIITISPSYFTRFAELRDVGHGDEVFGGDHWREVAQQAPSAKASWLLRTYRQTVKDAGFAYVLNFTLVDEGGHLLYLVFGTTNPKGVAKMKEAMWEGDQVHGVGYRDPRDPDQQTLEIEPELEPQTAPWERVLVDELSRCENGSATEQELRRFVLFETVYREAQASAVLKLMAESGRVLRTGDRRPGLAQAIRLT